jgi:[ribosomal protein S18]-alanine N-acetyltransferase
MLSPAPFIRCRLIFSTALPGLQLISRPNMNKLLVLKELTPNQYDEISRLWGLTGVGNPARGDSFEAVTQTLDNGARILLVYKDNEPAGTVWLTHDFRRLYIHHMAVHPGCQHQGLGRLLLQESLKIASDLKLQAKLEVHKDNHIAYGLYTGAGFETLEGYHTLIKRKF